MDSFFIMENIEFWKDIKGYEGLYQISNLGNVKSLNYRCSGYEKFLTKILCNNGYYAVNLSNNSIKKRIEIHQLVAIAFLNHAPCGFKLVVNHKNFIRTDNYVKNLEIITHRNNTNQKHLKSSSQYVGVYWNKLAKKWKASIVINRNKKHLGYFIDELDAHNAYQKALCEL